MDEELITKSEDAHHNMMKGMYFSGFQDTDIGRFLWSDVIDSCWWNYMTLINTVESKNVIQSAREFFNNKGRKLAFYITDLTKPKNMKEVLIDAKLSSEYIDSWMFYSGDKHLDFKSSFEIREAKTKKDMEVFLNIFNKAYSDEDDVYGVLPPEYGLALMKSFTNPNKDVQTLNYVAFENGRPIGVATVVLYNSFAGIYNVGTLTVERGKGVGSAITLKCVSEAFNKKAETVFLQTEKDSYNEKYYAKLGFSRGFLGECFVLNK